MLFQTQKDDLNKQKAIFQCISIMDKTTPANAMCTNLLGIHAKKGSRVIPELHYHSHLIRQFYGHNELSAKHLYKFKEKGMISFFLSCSTPSGIQQKTCGSNISLLPNSPGFSLRNPN
jgi:hypothetical protein